MTVILSTWNDTAVRRTLIDIANRVADPSGPNYVPPVERSAVFDNDGTLWCEQPMPVQVAGAPDMLAAIAARDPALREQQRCKAAFELVKIVRRDSAPRPVKGRPEYVNCLFLLSANLLSRANPPGVLADMATASGNSASY